MVILYGRQDKKGLMYLKKGCMKMKGLALPCTENRFDISNKNKNLSCDKDKSASGKLLLKLEFCVFYHLTQVNGF